MNLKEALALFIRQMEADGRSPHTTRQYERHILLLATWLAGEGRDEDLLALDHQALADFLVSPSARNRADGPPRRPTSMNALRSSLRVFFGYLFQAGLVSSNPAHLVRRAICGTAPPRELTEDEEARLRKALSGAKNALGRRDRALILTMLLAGLRVGSAVALRIGDVDLEAGEAHLQHAKGGRSESVVLGVSLAKELQEYLAQIDRRDGPLFAAQHGGPISTRHVQRRLSLWIARAGIRRRVSPHSLRRTCGTRLYRRTGDVFLVKEALSHRCISSAMPYISTTRDRLRAALT